MSAWAVRLHGLVAKAAVEGRIECGVRQLEVFDGKRSIGSRRYRAGQMRRTGKQAVGDGMTCAEIFGVCFEPDLTLLPSVAACPDQMRASFAADRSSGQPGKAGEIADVEIGGCCDRRLRVRPFRSTRCGRCNPEFRHLQGFERTMPRQAERNLRAQRCRQFSFAWRETCCVCGHDDIAGGKCVVANGRILDCSGGNHDIGDRAEVTGQAVGGEVG